MKIPDAASNQWVWLGAAGIAAIWFLCWNTFARNDDDARWTDPPNPAQPPEQYGSGLPMVPGPGCGAPMDCSPAFRSRSYPGNLTRAGFSIIGEF